MEESKRSGGWEQHCSAEPVPGGNILPTATSGGHGIIEFLPLLIIESLSNTNIQAYHPNIDLEGNVCLNIMCEDKMHVLNINTVIYGMNFLFVIFHLYWILLIHTICFLGGKNK